MERVKRLEAGDCTDLTPRMFVVNHGREEKLDRSVAALGARQVLLHQMGNLRPGPE